MMIVMKPTATQDEIQAVIERIESCGARAHPSRGEEVTVIGAIGDREHVARLGLEGAPGVEQLVPILKPYKLSSRQLKGESRSVVEIDGRRIGGDHFSLIAGPCTVESRDQTLTAARIVAAGGASLFRGGAYKPRSSPYAFQGLGQEGLRLLAEAKAETGLPIVTELMDARDIEPVLEVADVIQVGARNMQNYPLLAEIGRSGCPVLIKRGLSATLEELLMAAEYVLKEGNPNVLLCERGIRTFEPSYRFTLDLTAVPVLKELSHLPVIVDPSHAAGPALAGRAAVAGGGRRRRRRHHRRGAPAPRGGDLRRAAGAARRRLRRLRREGRGRGRGRRQGARPRPPDGPGAGARMSVAVLGVGLIGGSIGLAARERARRRGAGLRPRARRAARRRWRATCSTSRAPRPPRRSRAPRRRSSPRPSARCPPRCARRWRTPGPDCVVTDVGSAKRAVTSAVARPALHRRPPARGRRDGRRRARARRALRRRDLVPDAGQRDDRDPLRAPAPAARRARGAPAGARRRHPRPADGGGLPPAARAGQRARRPGRPRAAARSASGCPPPARASATPPASRAPRRRSGPTSTSPTPTRWSSASTTRSRACRRSAPRWPGATRRPSSAWNDGAAEDRRRLLEADLAGGAVTRAARRRCPTGRGSWPRWPWRWARGNVNIVDMALSPTADRSSGSIALWIAGEDQAAEAERLVAALGLDVARA